MALMGDDLIYGEDIYSGGGGDDVIIGGTGTTQTTTTPPPTTSNVPTLSSDETNYLPESSGSPTPVSDEPGAAITNLPQADLPTTPAPDQPAEVPPAEKYLKPDVFVEERIVGLMAKNNPYIQQARLSAQQWANTRGLLNTTIAAEAGEQAAIGKAGEIAAKDATTAAEMRGREQVTASQASLNMQQAGIMWDRTKLQGAIQSAIVGQEGEINSFLNQQQNKFTAFINAQQLDATLKNTFINMYADLSTTLATNIEYILRDEKLDAAAKTKAISLLTSRFENDLSTLSSIAGIGLIWT